MSRPGSMRFLSFIMAVASSDGSRHHVSTFESCSRRSESSWFARWDMLITENFVPPVLSVGQVAAQFGQRAVFLDVLVLGLLVLHG